MDKYMMATTARCRLGDASRETHQLCSITGEDGDDFIGSWVEGLGLVGVRFPKATTRELTDAEKQAFHGQKLFVRNRPTPIATVYTLSA